MLLKDMLAILQRILEKTDVTNVEVKDALNLVHVEVDDKTSEPVEDKKFPQEFDLILKNGLSHAEIQVLDEILADYFNLEMRLRDGNIEIFETFNEEEA